MSDVDNLMKLNRDQLNSLADTKKIENPSQYETKRQLAEQLAPVVSAEEVTAVSEGNPVDAPSDTQEESNEDEASDEDVKEQTAQDQAAKNAEIAAANQAKLDAPAPAGSDSEAIAQAAADREALRAKQVQEEQAANEQKAKEDQAANREDNPNQNPYDKPEDVPSNNPEPPVVDNTATRYGIDAQGNQIAATPDMINHGLLAKRQGEEPRGFGFPTDKYGRTLSIFGKNVHETVKYFAGLMVPLTHEEHAGKTDREIYEKLVDLKYLVPGQSTTPTFTASQLKEAREAQSNDDSEDDTPDGGMPAPAAGVTR